MRLGAPLALGGTRYLTAVTVGRDPDGETVWDCPACGGRCGVDEWHLEATVLNRADGLRATFRWCSPDCLRGWLRTAPAT